jgi:hypothetical protein
VRRSANEDITLAPGSARNGRLQRKLPADFDARRSSPAQLPVDREVVVERAAAAAEVRRVAQDLGHHAPDEGVGHGEGLDREGLGLQPVEEGEAAGVVDVVGGHEPDAGGGVQVVGDSVECEAIPRAAPRERTAGEEPPARLDPVADRRLADPVQHDARSALGRVVGGRQELERGRREADRKRLVDDDGIGSPQPGAGAPGDQADRSAPLLQPLDRGRAHLGGERVLRGPRPPEGPG